MANLKQKNISEPLKTVRIVFSTLLILLLVWLVSGPYRSYLKPNLRLPEAAGQGQAGDGSGETSATAVPEGQDACCGTDRLYLSDGHIVLNIFEGDDFETVCHSLSPVLRSEKSFVRAARREHYPTNVHTGHYVLKPGLNNRRLLETLGQGLQTPVTLRFHVVRTPEKLAGILSRQIMIDSTAIVTAFYDPQRLEALGLNRQTLPALFIPDTYEIWWNVSPERLMNHFEKVYKQFWTEERKAKAAANKLSPVQAATLASIVQDETNHRDEWSIIAGLYLNRMRKGMPLQACPTVKYAINDFTIRRVLKEYTRVESPYNTYLHRGLPPGPIGIARKEPLLAVIDAVPNNYLYMCAKDDFSGGHYFSSTLTQHNRYAERYHQALTRRRIRR